VLGTARVNRPYYWYAAILHTFIYWGFLTLQIRTLNFLIEGFYHDASLQHLFGSVYDVYRPVMDLFDVLVIIGVGWPPRSEPSSDRSG
jgi:hypothetical protein